MKLKNMSLEEMQVLSYEDLTYNILKENKTTMTTPEIFKEICSLLNYSDDMYADKIGDYYTSLTLDKRFVMLDDGKWDIRDHHSLDINIEHEATEDDDEEELSEDELDIHEEEMIDEEDDIETPIDDETDDPDDDFGDLNIIVDDENMDE